MNNVKALMNELGISISQLANKMGVTNQSLSDTLRNKNVSLSTLKRIAEVLDVELWELFVPRINNNVEYVSESECPCCQKKLRLKLVTEIKPASVNDRDDSVEDGEK